MFPWLFQQQKQKSTEPRDVLLDWLCGGVPPDLASRAVGIEWESIKDDKEVIMALAIGEISLFERARDSGVTGTVRAAMRRETNTWTPKAEAVIGLSLEDYLKDD